MLDEFGGAPVEVFAVWEPVLATDLAPPTTTVLGHLHNGRIRQYWDPRKLLSKQLIQAMRADPKLLKPGQSCRNVAWDVVMIYGPDEVWTEDIPFPRWWAAPILEVLEEVRAEPGHESRT